jgi:hypothetical protein
MDFVHPLAKKRPPLSHGWQCNTYEARGNAFYLHVASGRIVYKFEDMMSKNHDVAPLQTPLAPVELFPDKPVSVAKVVDTYATPHCFKDGSSSKPIVLDDYEVSEAHEDLTNSQLTKKKPPKRQKRVVYPAKRGSCDR